MVPTSAITGDGMGDLIALVVTYSQKMLAEKLMFSKELEAIVMEVSWQQCHTPTTFGHALTALYQQQKFLWTYVCWIKGYPLPMIRVCVC